MSEQPAHEGFLSHAAREDLRERAKDFRRVAAKYYLSGDKKHGDDYERWARDCDGVLAYNHEDAMKALKDKVCISRETMAVLRVWLDRFTDREAFPSGDPFYEATLALRGALEQTEASSE